MAGGKNYTGQWIKRRRNTKCIFECEANSGAVNGSRSNSNFDVIVEDCKQENVLELLIQN